MGTRMGAYAGAAGLEWLATSSNQTMLYHLFDRFIFTGGPTVGKLGEECQHFSDDNVKTLLDTLFQTYDDERNITGKGYCRNTPESMPDSKNVMKKMPTKTHDNDKWFRRYQKYMGVPDKEITIMVGGEDVFGCTPQDINNNGIADDCGKRDIRKSVERYLDAIQPFDTYFVEIDPNDEDGNQGEPVVADSNNPNVWGIYSGAGHIPWGCASGSGCAGQKALQDICRNVLKEINETIGSCDDLFL